MYIYEREFLKMENSWFYILYDRISGEKKGINTVATDSQCCRIIQIK